MNKFYVKKAEEQGKEAATGATGAEAGATGAEPEAGATGSEEATL